MPSLLNYEQFCEGLKEVTTTKIIDKKHFHPEGLFSEQIFGPLKNYTCQCGTYYGISSAGGTCKDCGVDVVNSNERRKRFAKIVLPIPVISPIFYDLLVELGGGMIKDAIQQLLKDEKSVLYWNDVEQEFRITEEENVQPGTEIWRGAEAIREMIHVLSQKLVDDGVDEWKIVLENINQLVITQVIVLPPDLRPASKGVTKNDQVVDKINRFYTQILTKKEAMRDTTLDVRRDATLYYSYAKQLQKDVNELYAHILDKLSKKEGLIRGNILGKRIDFSGRGVIVPDPTLKFDHCSLPYIMFLELFKLRIAKKLIQLGKYKLLNDAIDFVDECIELKKPVLFKICEEMAKGEVCMLNRQPSLHKLSLLGYYITVSLDNVIKIHPLSCPPFNADFDGDQMAVYLPITEESKQEVIDKLLVTKNLSNPSNGSLSTLPSQDMVLGVYALTTNYFPDLMDMVEYKGTQITTGMRLFNECLPKDYPVVNESVGSKKLVKILNDINRKCKPEETVVYLDKIKMLGFKYSTLFGATLSLDQCYMEDAVNIRERLYESDSIVQQVAMVSSKATERLLKSNFHYAYMIESGARGSWDQVRQIVLTRGFISNFNGHIIPEPIKNSFLRGLTPKEFFNSTYGSRKGLLDVALNTGTSGYLSRKLVFACANLQIDLDLEDCGTNAYLDVHVDSPKKARMLIGKWMKTKDGLMLITEDNYMSLISELIQIRSPIFCTSPKLCQKCYGELYKTLDTRFVGVIAAQSLGECNTQLVLRTFHTSGVAQLNNDEASEDMKQQDIVSDLSTVSKLLHQFKKETNCADLTHDLFTNYNHRRTIHHTHFECVVSQLMWSGIEKWRLTNNRETQKIEFHSVQTVPSYESWLMGLAFSNPKKHIIKGVLHPGLYKGVMDKILCGEPV